MTTPQTSETTAPRRQSSFKTLLGTGVGNAVEWYDWNIYASFAVYFSAQLFNSEDPRSAFLQTMAVFAVGFVARPFGGVLFGWIGDRIGRKPSLTLSILAASAGSLLIALSPTYEQIGWVASALLLLARLVQGLAHGGEMPAAQTYLAEFAPRERRGLFASSIYVSGTIGLLAGLAARLHVRRAFRRDGSGRRSLRGERLHRLGSLWQPGHGGRPRRPVVARWADRREQRASAVQGAQPLEGRIGAAVVVRARARAPSAQLLPGGRGCAGGRGHERRRPDAARAFGGEARLSA